jgi:hypothetical protein
VGWTALYLNLPPYSKTYRHTEKDGEQIDGFLKWWSINGQNNYLYFLKNSITKSTHVLWQHKSFFVTIH